MTIVTEAFKGRRLVLKDREDGVVLASVDPRVPFAEAMMIAFQLAADQALTLGAMDARLGNYRDFDIIPGETLLRIMDGSGSVIGSSWVCGAGDLGHPQVKKMLDLVRRSYAVGRKHALCDLEESGGGEPDAGG
jgi:hypothetical protein